MSANGLSLLLFFTFVTSTLFITYWAKRRTQNSADYFAAGRGISGWQNGLALAGDYLSGATLLGVTGLIALYGFDGFLYLAGFLVAFLVVLVLVAELLRNAARYTLADALSLRLSERPIRTAVATSTLTISVCYLMAQMVGAGALLKLLLGLEGPVAGAGAIVAVGALMILYVAVGGMIGTTWVQIIKAVLLLMATGLLTVLVLAKAGFSLGSLITSAQTESGLREAFLAPGGYFKNPLDLVSLSLALVLGTAGLPHVLMRFYTVPNARAARSSTTWAIGIIGTFYLGLCVIGLGAAAFLGRAAIVEADPAGNMAAPLLAGVLGGGEDTLGGALFLAALAAVAFATILAVVAGLTITAATTFAHDLYAGVLRRGTVSESGEVSAAKKATLVIGAVSVVMAIAAQSLNLAFLVGLVFAIAASAHLPVLLLTFYWQRLTTTGAVLGIYTGLGSAVGLVLVSPTVIGPTGLVLNSVEPLFPLANPGLVSIPLGFVAAVVGSLLTRDSAADRAFQPLQVRSLTGHGAEEAVPH